VALAGAYLTGFTFRLNTAAPVSADRLVYLVPYCLCPPDSTVQTNLEAVRVRDGQIQWRHPIRRSGLGPNDTFISDDQHVYLEQYAPDAAHLREYVVTALDAHSGHQVWRVTSATGGTLVSAANGRLTLSTLQTTLLLDAATGQALVQVSAGNAAFEWQHIAYACTDFDQVATITATDEATGRKLWTSPNVFGFGLAMTLEALIASGQGVVTALPVSDSVLLWRASDGPGSSPPLILGDAVVTSVPARPLAAGQHGVMHARRVGDGALLWQRTMGSYPVVYGAPDEVVLAATDTAASGAAIVALRASDGRQRWSFPEAYASPFVTSIVAGVVLLGYASSRQLVALNLQTGLIYWQTML
jgi:outer membrane protein assembly factor BamB